MDAYIPSESGTHKRPALFVPLSLPVHYMSSNERYFISISYRDKTFFQILYFLPEQVRLKILFLTFHFNDYRPVLLQFQSHNVYFILPIFQLPPGTDVTV